MADLPDYLRHWYPGYKRGAPHFEQHVNSPLGPRIVVGAVFKPDGEVDEAASAATVALVSAAPELRAALEAVMVGGNHLATYKTAEWPAPDTDPQDALRILCATKEFDMWCCWAAIMRAHAALAKARGEA